MVPSRYHNTYYRKKKKHIDLINFAHKLQERDKWLRTHFNSLLRVWVVIMHEIMWSNHTVRTKDTHSLLLCFFYLLENDKTSIVNRKYKFLCSCMYTNEILLPEWTMGGKWHPNYRETRKYTIAKNFQWKKEAWNKNFNTMPMVL